MGRKGDFREEVLRLYAEGQSVDEILELVDISYDGALRILKKNGVYKKTAKKVDDVDKLNLLQLIDADENATEAKIKIASKYFYAGKAFDTPLELRNFKIELGKEIRKLFEEGRSREEIAEKFGIRLLSVARFLD